MGRIGCLGYGPHRASAQAEMLAGIANASALHRTHWPWYVLFAFCSFGAKEALA
jgi:hypothetical protein